MGAVRQLVNCVCGTRFGENSNDLVRMRKFVVILKLELWFHPQSFLVPPPKFWGQAMLWGGGQAAKEGAKNPFYRKNPPKFNNPSE